MNYRVKLFSVISFGAGLLYFLDSEHGRERRARLRPHMARIAKTARALTGSALQCLGRNLGNAADQEPASTHGVLMSDAEKSEVTVARQERTKQSGPSGSKEWDRLRRYLPTGCQALARGQLHGQIPLWLKLSCTFFVVLLVPVYATRYGVANFLWFSDIALLALLLALWYESRLLVSMQAVSVTLLESVWILDFFSGLVTNVSPFGLTAYMFDSTLPLFLRALSLFHLVLPPLLLWLLYRLGYDPRAWLAQTLVAWVVLPVCYFFTAPTANINWVFGPGQQAQTWLPPSLYFLLVMLVFPFGIYLPTHMLLNRWFAGRTRH